MKRSSSLLVATFVLGLSWSFPIPAQCADSPATVEICDYLSNPSFENGLTGWTSVDPSDKGQYIVPVPHNPAYTPIGASSAIQPLSGNGFAGCTQAGETDQKKSCRLDHSVVNGNWPAGTQFRITVLANHGRDDGGLTPNWTHNLQSDLHVLFRSYSYINGIGSATELRYKFVEEGAWTPALGKNGLPAANPRTGTKPNNPNGYGDPVNTWISRTITFTAPFALKSFSLSFIGLNDAHDSFILFDTDCGATPPLPTPTPGNQPPREP